MTPPRSGQQGGRGGEGEDRKTLAGEKKRVRGEEERVCQTGRREGVVSTIKKRKGSMGEIEKNGGNYGRN